jgi:hypothetical protein
MSVGNKKKDRDNQGSSTSSGGEATANKVTNSQEGITTQKEKVTSASSSQQNQTPSERMTTTTTTTSEVPHYQYQQHQQRQQREQQQSLNRALDQTKDNIKRSTDEARKEIPRYTQAVNDYQEQTIQAAREITDNYIESQRQIINSLQSAWVPQIEEANKVFTSNWISPRYFIEIYANMVSSFADNMIAATRLVNNIIFANMDAFKTSIQQAKDNAKELSRIGVNSARTFEQTSRGTTATPRIGSENTSTARVYVEREQEERDQRRI